MIILLFFLITETFISVAYITKLSKVSWKGVTMGILKNLGLLLILMGMFARFHKVTELQNTEQKQFN